MGEVVGCESAHSPRLPLTDQSAVNIPRLTPYMQLPCIFFPPATPSPGKGSAPGLSFFFPIIFLLIISPLKEPCSLLILCNPPWMTLGIATAAAVHTIAAHTGLPPRHYVQHPETAHPRCPMAFPYPWYSIFPCIVSYWSLVSPSILCQPTIAAMPLFTLSLSLPHPQTLHCHQPYSGFVYMHLLYFVTCPILSPFLSHYPSTP
ncbi:hypothetical protein F5B22DRAFT_284044 [Xylaria bambusicola]|uniref:uncharacterized protein n=1 Tax=Xylaria bambusicola TaxID=326684 RepID=UPI0020073396|nr:uncharacterized protein F5B22DRAFT_284044 [Xylaria bambusicola]KAI0513028.1 hypothetical protein F5B22DRAFT_284044 [Xylaria bambusicola]